MYDTNSVDSYEKTKIYKSCGIYNILWDCFDRSFSKTKLAGGYTLFSLRSNVSLGRFPKKLKYAIITRLILTTNPSSRAKLTTGQESYGTKSFVYEV